MTETVRPAWLTDEAIDAAAVALYDIPSEQTRVPWATRRALAGDGDAIIAEFRARARAALLAAAPFVSEHVKAVKLEWSARTPPATEHPTP